MSVWASVQSWRKSVPLSLRPCSTSVGRADPSNRGALPSRKGRRDRSATAHTMKCQVHFLSRFVTTTVPCRADSQSCGDVTDINNSAEPLPDNAERVTTRACAPNTSPADCGRRAGVFRLNGGRGNESGKTKKCVRAAKSREQNVPTGFFKSLGINAMGPLPASLFLPQPCSPP